MLKCDDKDGIIEFLKQALEKIRKEAEDSNVWSEGDDDWASERQKGLQRIYDISDKALMDVTF